jgi:hypothetical protein
MVQENFCGRSSILMCGIFGFSRLTDLNRPMFPVLASEMEGRGSSSWGASNGNCFTKNLGAIMTTFSPSILSWETNSGLIVHTRAPSSGTGLGAANAHPFVFTKVIDEPIAEWQQWRKVKSVIGIHNGYVDNYQKLNAKYEDRCNFSVDSMHIFKSICDGTPLDEIFVSGVIVWYEIVEWERRQIHEYVDESPPEPRQVNLFVARIGSEAFHAAKMEDNSIVFASTELALVKAANFVGVSIREKLVIEPECRYELLCGEDSRLEKIDSMIFGRIPARKVVSINDLRDVNTFNKYIYNTPNSLKSKGIRLELVENTCPGCGVVEAFGEVCAICWHFWRDKEPSFWQGYVP